MANGETKPFEQIETKPRYKVLYEIAEQAVLKVGYPIIVSAIFILVFLGVLTSPLTRTEAKVDAHIAITDLALKEDQAQTRLLLTICKSLAKPQSCIEDLIPR